MADEVSGGWVPGRPRLGWMDNLKQRGSREVMMEAARQCSEDRKERRAPVHK